MTLTTPTDRFKSIAKSILFLVAFTAILALSSFLKKIFPPQYERIIYGFIGTIVALLVTWLFLRVEKKTFSDIGLKWERKTLQRYLLGFVIGLAISSLLIFILIFFAHLKLEWAENYNILSFLLWTLALIPLAFLEEVAFRAYAFKTLEKATGIRVTQFIIAILFAVYHFAGGQSLFSSFMGPGIWSFVFGLAVIMSGGISVATGVHVGANLFLAAIGQQKGFQSIWTIQYSGEMTATMQQHIENIGNAIQIGLFVVVLIIMEWYLRKKKKTVSNQKQTYGIEK